MNGNVTDQLRAVLGERVITPAHPEYEQMRSVMVPVDRRPLAIVRPENASQVALAVEVSSRAGIELAVRSGGHSGAGHGAIDDGVVIDLREMSRIEIDEGARTAWVEAGATAGQVTQAAGARGLAIGFGDNASVGVGGLTLGGGVGYLSRAHGLTIDNLLGAEIVTAAGAVLEIDGTRHPELFWAIRGGGGNFGVVTRFKYRMIPLDTVVGGMLVLPADSSVLVRFVAQATAAPEELTTMVNVMAAPPLPFLPEDLHGRLVLMANVCYCGPVEEADTVLAPFKALAEPLADLVRPVAYTDLIEPVPEGYNPSVALRNLFLDELSPAHGDEIIGALGSADRSRAMMQFRVLGGAIDRVPAGDTAYAHRGASMLAMVASFYDEPDERPAHERWVREVAGRLGGWGASVNFLSDEGAERVRDAYPGPTFARLAEAKAQYDPDNVFRRNQNVPPSSLVAAT